MGYFDSSKNRALWDIELQNLRKLRAERMSGKQVKAEPVETKTLTGKEPVRMTYQELLKEETAAIQKAPKKERQREKSLEHSKEQQKESRQKEAHAYEKV